MESNVNLTFPPHTTASSGIVASKPPSQAVKKNQLGGSKILDSKPGFATEHDALSAEDDSREKDMAMFLTYGVTMVLSQMLS